jgi:hypothetical protein
MTPSQVNDPNILEDYTLKYVWGPKTQQLHPFGAPVKIQTPSKAPVATSTTRAGLTQLVAARQLSRFSQRQKKPDLGQALRPFLRNCTVLEQIPEGLFCSRSQKDR